MRIKIGGKYTCSLWSNMFYLLVDSVTETKVITHTYNYSDYNDDPTRHEWSIDFFCTKNTDLKDIRFYPLFKEVKNTALARKMYPDAEIDGEWLVIHE